MKERVGAKIKAIRTDRLMTQSELAGNQFTRSMISLIEHGHAEPSIPNLEYLADRLRVSPAYLLASETEEAMYRRAMKIGDIRIAYRTGEYRICHDLCVSLGLDGDDELNALIAECRIALAIGEIADGRLYEVGAYLEGALEAAERTGYRVSHIYAAAAVIERYLGRFSERFYFEADTRLRQHGVPLAAASGDPFCAYAMMLLRTDRGGAGLRDALESGIEMLKASAPLYAAHVEERLLLSAGDYAAALEAIEAIPEGGHRLPIPMLYELFCDKEICLRAAGDMKGAGEAAGAKQELLSRILSES